MKPYISKNILMVFAVTLIFSLNAIAFDNFITADGYRLMDGDEEFRFISFNIPNLNFIEDELPFERPHPFGLPTAYEIEDAMVSIQQMGGNVIRMYTIPVRREIDTPDVPRYVLAPGKFDERAFVTMDTMLALANKTGVRVIIPLVNAWKWMGGRPQYAGFRGKTEEEFWTDPQLINDFKKTIAYVINRKNTVTGLRYRDDKAILCWETGNELPCPHSWTRTITAYIRSLDPNHLIMDGYNAFDGRLIHEEALMEPTVDIVTSHHYATDPAQFISHIQANRALIKGRKPYIIGEFGFLGTSAFSQMIDLVMDNHDVAGALIWSLRYHRHQGGFYWHSEPLGYGVYKAYHWPGFDSGNEYDERGVLTLMRNSAYAIQGKPVPTLPVPEKPNLLSISNVASISWQGSAGASGYDVERQESSDGLWMIVGYDISDADVQYTPLFHDASAEIGKMYYYRVKAKNVTGVSEPSNSVGPVTVANQAIIDEMQNFMTLYHTRGDLMIKTDEDRKFKEDMERMEGQKECELIYWTPGPITRMKTYAYAESDQPTLSFSVSADHLSYTIVPVQIRSTYSGRGDYAYWRPTVYEMDKPDMLANYLKIEFKEKTQISRVEIYYGQ